AIFRLRRRTTSWACAAKNFLFAAPSSLNAHGKVLSGDTFLVHQCVKSAGTCTDDIILSAGALHWKVVSVYINRMGLVSLKMKSRHVAGTITKKKKGVVIDVCKDVAAWPGRHLLEDGEHRRYFGLRTADHRVIEFECTSQREYELWTKGVARLLSIAGERKRPL
uniref:Pleckstrin-like plant domain-containing protein n=1 Tax=Aegilops tauschii subsp. strangulata TaxID=200361 RepID=A0A453LR28_AEGTS